MSCIDSVEISSNSAWRRKCQPVTLHTCSSRRSMHGGHLRYDMSIPSKNNSASFSKADLERGAASPTKLGVYWFQSENMARALMVEVRVMNGVLTVWWP